MCAYLAFTIFFAGLSSTAAEGIAQEKNNGLIRYENLGELISKNNQNVEAARINVEAKQERTGRLARSFLPDAGAFLGAEAFSYGDNPTNAQGYWKLEASLNLYRGGKDQLEEKLRESKVSEAQAESSLSFIHELKEAQKSYWQLLSASKLKESLEKAIEQNRTSLRSAQKRQGAGISTAADTLQFELHQTDLSQKLKTLKLREGILKNRLSTTLGIKETESFEIQEEFPPIQQSATLNLKSENQLSLRLLKAQKTSKYLAYEQASRWWAPTLKLYTSYGLPTLSDEYERAISDEREFEAGLVLGLPLGTGLEGRSEASALLLEAKAVESQNRHRAREVKALEQELIDDLNLLGALIQESEADLGKAQRFMSLTQDEYNRGVKNGPDLLNAIQTFYQFQERNIHLHGDYFEKKSQLDALLTAG